MRYLLDTHVLIWHSEGKKLKSDIIEILANPENVLYVSHATLWEMTIKESIGKIEFNFEITDFENVLIQNQFTILPFDFKNYRELRKLPFHHQDPFDRMLVSQAISENIPIITHDEKVMLYDVEVVKV
jgi:PIN domain nuclease of toxin-antitoxin system